MRSGNGRPTSAGWIWGVLLVAVLGLGGCIAVSRETRRETVPSPGGGAVPAGGHWQADQEWQCDSASLFDLVRERRDFQPKIERRLDRGWDLADFDVVSVPQTSEQADQTCLVATFRRWIED